MPNPRDQMYPSQTSQPLIHVLTHNSSLHFRPFSPSEYQQNIHDAFYRCQARSESGVAISRRVRVRAGESKININKISHISYSIHFRVIMIKVDMKTYKTK